MVGALVQLPVGPLLALDRHRHRVRRAAPPAPRTAHARHFAADRPPAVSFHSTSTCCRSASASSGNSDSCGSGSRQHRLQQHAPGAPPCRPPSPRRTGRCCTPARPAARRSSSSPASASGRTWPCRLSTSNGAQRQPRQSAAAAAVRSAGRTSPGTAASGSGPAPAAAPPPASRTAGPGARRPPAPPPAPAPAARGTTGRPTGRVRSTSVLTKKPMRPSVSARFAAGDGRAHHDVLLARCSGTAAPGRPPAAS